LSFSGNEAAIRTRYEELVEACGSLEPQNRPSIKEVLETLISVAQTLEGCGPSLEDANDEMGVKGVHAILQQARGRTVEQPLERDFCEARWQPSTTRSPNGNGTNEAQVEWKEFPDGTSLSNMRRLDNGINESTSLSSFEKDCLRRFDEAKDCAGKSAGGGRAL